MRLEEMAALEDQHDVTAGRVEGELPVSPPPAEVVKSTYPRKIRKTVERDPDTGRITGVTEEVVEE